MVKEGIVLGHHISEKGLEVDREKVEVIETSPTHLYKRCEKFSKTCRLLPAVYKGFLKNCISSVKIM